MTFPDSSPEFVTDPSELAIAHAHIVAGGPVDAITEEEERLLAELDLIADASGFMTTYFVETAQALAIPVSWDRDEPVTIAHFQEGLTFHGELASFSVCKIGRLAIGDDVVSVKALSLAFTGVTLLPYFDKVADDQLLYVPAYAVDDMQMM